MEWRKLMNRYRVTAMIVVIASLVLAGCVTPGEGPVSPGAPAMTAAPATLTPAPLPTATATLVNTPAGTPGSTAVPGVYGYAPDYTWLSGLYTVDGPCQRLVYDPAGADQYGGATYVTWGVEPVPAGNTFVTIKGGFIPSDRPEITGCPASTYLASAVTVQK
jgi:hypothetical protein